MNKRFLYYVLIFSLSLFSSSLFSQVPEKISFQAVIRDSANKLVSNSSIGMKISILKNSSTGSSVYVESHTPMSNSNGLVSVEIGSGTIVSGSFSNISWATDTYFLKVETDPKGGTSYTLTSSSQLLSVPYSLHAKTSDRALNNNDIDSTNEIQTLSIIGDSIFLTNGGTIKLPTSFNGKYSNLIGTPKNLSDFSNDVGYITSSSNGDRDSLNEIQFLTKAGGLISLSKNGNSVSINDNDSLPTNEIQTLKKIGDTLYLSSNGGKIALNDNDNQDLSSQSNGINRTINISGGSGTTIDIRDFDSDSTNELQSLIITKDSIGLSGTSNFLKFPSKWSLFGDSGTIDGTNFIGTTDSTPLNFRVNNKKAGRIDLKNGNTFLGYESGNKVTNGSSNVAIGYQTLHKFPPSGPRDKHVAIGYQALHNKTSGDGFVAVGYRALYSATIGHDNVAIGTESMLSTLKASRNVAVGNSSLRANVNGGSNTALGNESLYTNTSGSLNVAVGHRSLYLNTTGGHNTALGLQALYSNTTGNHNVAIGVEASYSGIAATNNISIGWRAMYSNTNGENNIGIGRLALNRGATGNHNIAIGNEALYLNIANSNIAIGYKAARNMYSGTRNIIIGDSVLAQSGFASNQVNIANIIFATNANGKGTTISDGKVGIKKVTPRSSLDVGGSFGSPITITSSNLTLDDSHHTVIVNTGTPTIVFASAGITQGRIYVIVNRTGSAITTSSYNAISGTSLTSIPAHSKIRIQSDGSAWYQID